MVQAKKQGFLSLWKQALPYFKHVSILTANLEGPIAPQINRHGRRELGKSPWDPPISTSYPRFNYPPQLASALAASHVTIATTANNHGFDRFSIGVDKTIDILRQHHIIALGSKKKLSSRQWYRVTRTHGINIAWIACTDSLNGIKDHHHQILRCNTNWGRKTILSIIHKLKHQVDSIVKLPHWGNEYQQQPNRWQKHLQTVLNAGASIVIGTHPHVLQPFMQYTTPDHRHTFIAYSLGNFVSNQGTPTNRASMILFIGLAKHKQHTIISSIRYQPTYMQNRSRRQPIHLMVLHRSSQNRFAWRFIKKIIYKHA